MNFNFFILTQITTFVVVYANKYTCRTHLTENTYGESPFCLADLVLDSANSFLVCFVFLSLIKNYWLWIQKERFTAQSKLNYFQHWLVGFYFCILWQVFQLKNFVTETTMLAQYSCRPHHSCWNFFCMLK
jgi:hypothetical protein